MSGQTEVAWETRPADRERDRRLAELLFGPAGCDTASTWDQTDAAVTEPGLTVQAK